MTSRQERHRTLFSESTSFFERTSKSRLKTDYFGFQEVKFRAKTADAEKPKNAARAQAAMKQTKAPLRVRSQGSRTKQRQRLLS